MRIACDNPHHDAGEGVCVFCVQGRIDKAVREQREGTDALLKEALEGAIKEKMTSEVPTMRKLIEEGEFQASFYRDAAAARDKHWKTLQDANLQVDEMRRLMGFAKAKDIINELVLERALKKDRERVIRLIDSILLHLPICQTNAGSVGACCNCGIERLKMEVEDGAAEPVTPTA